MAKRTVIDCDKCGRKDVDGIHFAFPIDSKTDAAGSSETIDASGDLCNKCAAAVIHSLAMWMTMASRERWVGEQAWIK